MIDFRIAATVASLAPKLAHGLVDQGWEGDGSTYDIGVYSGDSQAFDDAIGRPSTREERIALERAIRAELTRRHEVAS